MDALRHVLYVDDEPDMRMLVQLTLENIGNMKVSLCENAIDVLETAIDQHPQLIILDALMPGIDGPELLALIRKDTRLSDIPVIFLTARTAQADIDALVGAGAIGVINKPFDLTSLPQQVRSLWEKHNA